MFANQAVHAVPKPSKYDIHFSYFKSNMLVALLEHQRKCPVIMNGKIINNLNGQSDAC